MQLESGEMLKCDVVIYATGYETGWGDLKLLKDGEVVDAGDVPCSASHGSRDVACGSPRRRV